MSADLKVPEKFQYLRPQQIGELDQEARNIDQQLAQPDTHGADRGEMVRRRRKIAETLDTQSPPDITPEQRDEYVKEAKRLEGEFVPSMLSGEELRKNPQGAVDKNVRWVRKYNRMAARWKNIQRVLHKGDDSPNVASIENLRDHRTTHDLPMVSAQIPGTVYSGTNPSPNYLAGHERTFGGGNPDDCSGPVPADAQPPARARARKKPKKSTARPVAMKCGEMKDPRGRIFHEKSCQGCQQASAAESA